MTSISVKPCRMCGVGVALTAYQIRNAVYICRGCTLISHRTRLAITRPIAREFINRVNAATFCATCGAQPVEWHNPEHVEMNLGGRRISNMVGAGRAIATIREELARCTPLCRRCHMTADGRMDRLVERAKAPRPSTPTRPCTECSRLYKPLRRGLCNRCNERARYARKKEPVNADD